MEEWMRLLPPGATALVARILNTVVGNGLWQWYSLIGWPWRRLHDGNPSGTA